MTNARPGIARLSLALAAGVFLSNCGSPPKSEVVVSVKDQRMGLYHDGVLQKQYPISTSKFGLGDQPNSYRTPVGRHEIIAKIGKGLPAGAVLKSRSWNGEVLKPNAPGRDPIVSRILWLRGLESSNRNAMKRFIYIHGTTEENRLGQPASYGCIRMGMKDVVDVFDNLGIGAKVVVTKEHLPHGKKAEQPKAQPEAVPAPAGPAPITPPAPSQILASVPTKPTGPVTPEKAAALAAAAAAPIPADPVPLVAEPKSSLFSFLPWSRGKSKPAEVPPVQEPQPEVKSKVSVSNKRAGIRPPTEMQIGPVAPEPLAKGKGKKDRVEKVSSATSTVTRQLGRNAHS